MKQLISFAIGAITVIGSMFWVWTASLGSYRELSSYWIPEMYTVKAHAAESITGPKIIIMSGSNALFGLDSQALAQMTGKPVVNMASHAALPFGFLAEQVMPHIKAGDVVVAPLEFEYYRRDPALSDFEVANMESWGWQYAASTPLRSITYFRNTSLLHAIKDYLSPLPAPSSPPLAELIATAEANTRRGVSKWVGYSPASLNSFGDALVDQPNTYHEDRDYMPHEARPEFTEELAAFKNEVEAKGATLFLTWPVSSRNRDFDLDDAKPQQALALLRDALIANGLRINCDPAAFHFAQNLFLDTEYHLGLEGAERRTVALAECMAGKRVGDATIMIERRRRQAVVSDGLASQ